MSVKESWYILKNPEETASPALLIYPDRVRGNIELMIKIAGNVNRLRPHVKTHKLPELVALQVSYGIRKFKCATIAEAEMTAQNGGEDILLAYQPVGPHIERFFKLKQMYPEVSFSTVVDNPVTVKRLSLAAVKHQTFVDLYIDVDNGMHRTGIDGSDEVLKLVRMISSTPGLVFSGLHVYDGHIQESDPELREQICLRDFEPVLEIIRILNDLSIEVPHLVAGGTPGFPIHSRFNDRELSPGTTILWDWSYSSLYQDMDFQHAAVLLARVVSKNQKETLCLDLGYKALSADKPHPRIHFMGIEKYIAVNHSEEHLVIQAAEAAGFDIGDVVYGIPAHICPSVAMYEEACVIENHVIVDSWKIIGRSRKLTV